jgi:hypothetical protein
LRWWAAALCCRNASRRNSVRSRHNGGSGRRIPRGIVAWGSNASTAKEAAKEIVAAEADRDALIEMIDPRVIPDGTRRDGQDNRCDLLAATASPS